MGLKGFVCMMNGSNESMKEQGGAFKRAIRLIFPRVTSNSRLLEHARAGHPYAEPSWILDCFSSSKDPMFCLQPDGSFLYANPAMMSLCGISLTEICEKNIANLSSQISENHWIQIYKTVKGGESVVRQISLKSHHQISQVNITFNWVENYDLVFGVGRLLPLVPFELPRAENRQSEKQYQGLIESQSDLVIRIDWEGHFTFVNDAYCAKAGKTREELINSKFIPQVHPEDAPKIFQFMKRLAQPPFRGVGTHRSWTSGGWRHFQWEACAIKDDFGKVVELQGVGRDINDQKETERKLRERTNELIRRNSELEQFAYVASHDLKEPLRMISSFLQLLSMKYGCQIPKEGQQYIEYALDGSHRMLQLIQDLLKYSQVSSSRMQTTNVNLRNVVEEVSANLRLLIEESKANLVYHDLPEVLGNSSFLVQLFQNLVDNSIKYRRNENPRIVIRAVRQGSWYVFSVSDNGLGFDQKYRERIFKIFQRLDPQRKCSGNGIGLTVAKRIVERHDGKIWVDSKEGVGTTFHFTLPAARQEFTVTHNEIWKSFKEGVT